MDVDKFGTKKATGAFAAIMVLVSIVAFNLIGNLPVFADHSVPEYISANQADQVILGSGGGTARGPAQPRVLAAPTVLLEDDFGRADSGTVGSPSVGGPWDEVEQAGASVSISDEKLFFDDTSDQNNHPLVKSSFTVVSTATLTWDFDFDWTRSDNEGTYIVLMQLGDGASMANDSQNAGIGPSLIWTRFGEDHEILGYRDSSGDHELEFLSGAKHISVVANVDAGTYTVKVGAGGVTHASIPFHNGVSLNQLRFLTHQVNEEKFEGRTFDNVKISAETGGNIPPVADAGPDRSGVAKGATVFLTGSGSFDPDLGPGDLTYGWDFLAMPGSSTTMLTGARTAMPSFVVDATGTYVVELEISDGAAMDTDTVTITTASTGSGVAMILFGDEFVPPGPEVGTPEVGSFAWTELESSGTSVSVNDAEELFFEITADAGNRPVARNEFTAPLTGTLFWDFDFNWSRTDNERDYRVLMQLGDKDRMSDSSQNTGVGINLVWTQIDGDHESLGYRDSSGDNSLMMVSGAHHISVEVDQDAKEYEVTVDGAVVGTGIPFHNMVALNGVRYLTDGVNHARISNRTFDNVVIKTAGVVGPAPLVISSDSAMVSSGDTVAFTATGGTAPYVFSFELNNSGATINDPSAGVYKAGTVSGTEFDLVKVTDDNGDVAAALITVGP